MRHQPLFWSRIPRRLASEKNKSAGAKYGCARARPRCSASGTREQTAERRMTPIARAPHSTNCRIGHDFPRRPWIPQVPLTVFFPVIAFDLFTSPHLEIDWAVVQKRTGFLPKKFESKSSLLKLRWQEEACNRAVCGQPSFFSRDAMHSRRHCQVRDPSLGLGT